VHEFTELRYSFFAAVSSPAGRIFIVKSVKKWLPVFGHFCEVTAADGSDMIQGPIAFSPH